MFAANASCCCCMRSGVAGTAFGGCGGSSIGDAARTAEGESSSENSMTVSSGFPPTLAPSFHVTEMGVSLSGRGLDFNMAFLGARGVSLFAAVGKLGRRSDAGTGTWTGTSVNVGIGAGTGAGTGFNCGKVLELSTSPANFAEFTACAAETGTLDADKVPTPATSAW